MKIVQLSFENKARPWQLEKTGFSGLTLLVGASGVGKTMILNSIVKLINISNGAVYNGACWDLYFKGENGENYRWTGEFKTVEGLGRQLFDLDAPNFKTPDHVPRLAHEHLYLEDRLVFEREEDRVKYEKKDAPRVSPHTSILDLFTTEDKIAPVKKALRKVMLIDYHTEKCKKIPAQWLKAIGGDPPHIIVRTVPSLISKLLLAYKSLEKNFKQIVDDFRDIFPQVEDIRFELLEEEDVYRLQIKERGTGWISMEDISSGMFKTLMHLVEIKLMQNGGVILIDEFENSLGVNCIDAVANDLLAPERELQYIITSHHPYIINNIAMKYWKVVTRQGSRVSTKGVEQLKLGKSRHEAFKQLINLEEFTGGAA